MSLPPSREPSSKTGGRPSRMELRAATSGACGTALEFFDFTVYGLLAATVFPQLFFSGLGDTGALLASFTTFGVGIAARPLGAIIFGHLGDRFGRRPILWTTLLLIGIVSCVMGLLPTGKGAVVASMLVALRFVQGFALGGELSAGQLMAAEHAGDHRRGMLGSWVGIGSPLSQVAATGLLALLTAVLSDGQWHSWGWRIPLLSGFLIVAVAAFIRLKLTETPAFEVAHGGASNEQPGVKHKGMGIGVLLTHPREVIQLIFLHGGFSLCFFLIVVWGLGPLNRVAGFTTSTIFVVLLIGNAVSVFATLIGGAVSDRIGRKRTAVVGIAGCTGGVVLFFVVLPTGSVVAITVAITLILCSIQFYSGAVPAFFAEQFPTNVRLSGIGVSYTFANLVFSTPAPIVATALAASGGTFAVMWLAVGAMAISTIALIPIRDRTGVNLTTFVDITQETHAGIQPHYSHNVQA